MLHRGGFAVGRAPLTCVEYRPSPALSRAPRALMLVTGRTLEHYNTGSMTRRSPNVVLRSDDRLEIHPKDARRRGIADGDAVLVESAWGAARAVAIVTTRVRPGTLFLTFHFPATGTNRVTSDVVDRHSGCPEYKLTPVEVARLPDSRSHA